MILVLVFTNIIIFRCQVPALTFWAKIRSTCPVLYFTFLEATANKFSLRPAKLIKPGQCVLFAAVTMLGAYFIN